MKDEEILIPQRIKDSRRQLADWRAEARGDYDFVSSRQWDEADLAKLREEERPALTFNRAEVFIDAVVGNEINARLEAKFLPRGMTPDVQVAEILNATSDWVRDSCNAEQEEQDAIRDMAICGVGVVGTRMDYEEDADGKILKERLDPLMCGWDPSAKKQCLEDRQYDWYQQWVDKQTAMKMWPDAEFTQEEGVWEKDTDPGLNDPGTWYSGADEKDQADRKNQVLITHYECWKRQEYVKALDPASGKIVEMDLDRFKKVKSAYKGDLQSVRLTRKVYYRAFLAGDEVLEYTKSPVQCFTRQFITGKRDRNRNRWYGLTRVMKDPQKWANKFLSTILSIIASNAKGGVFYESNVFVDQRKAEDAWATAAPLIEVSEGALSQGKLKERTPPPIPAGLERLMLFSFDSLPFVTGINLEALGLADRQQAGVLEAQRRKAAFGILAPLLEGIRRFRKNDAKVTYEFIREFIPDGTMIRVVGDQGDVKYVPLVKDAMTGKYDISVDEAPESPDFKEKTWEIMTQILPILMKSGYPIPPEIWKFSPLPSTISEKWVQMAAQGPQIPESVQNQIKELQSNLVMVGKENQTLKEENTKLKTDFTVDMLKVGNKMAESKEKVRMKTMEMQNEAVIQQFEVIMNAALEKMKAELDARTKIMTARMAAQAQVISDSVKSATEEKKASKKGKIKKTDDGYILPSGAKVKRTADGLVIE